MTDEEKKKSDESEDSSTTETPRPSHSQSSDTFDPKEMERRIEEARDNAKPRAIVNPAGGIYAPGRGPPKKTPPSTGPSFLQKNKKTIEIGVPLAIIGIVIGLFNIPGVYDTVFPPTPEINVTDLNALDGIVEGNKFVYSYEPRTYTPNGTKNEVFSLKISNTGNANAHNFWIIMDSKPDGLWFDFNNSAIMHEGDPTPCQQKSSYCTIGLVPKDSSNLVVKYSVTFDHKLFQEIEDESPKLLFNYGFDEGKEQTIGVQLKFD